MQITRPHGSEDCEQCKLADGHMVASKLSARAASRWQVAAQRFRQSGPVRRRVSDGLEHLGTAERQQAQNREKLRRGLIDERDTLGQERVLGNNDLLQINFLARGLRAAQAVSRIHIATDRGAPDGFGTGFLVSPGLLLTNQHVLPGPEFAKFSVAEFDFSYDEDYRFPGPESFQLAPNRFFYANAELDFALVAVQPIGRGGRSLGDYGYAELIAESGKALDSESLAIIQHPAGRDKHVCLRNTKLLTRFEDFVHYEADTLPGSSGSPVFNDQWSVVALHHCSVPNTNSIGEILRRDGQRWKPGESHERISWIANEGVRISSIFGDLQRRAQEKLWSASQVRVLEGFADATRSTLHEDLAKASARRPIFVKAAAYKHPEEPARPLTVEAFQEKLNQDNCEESIIAPYFELADDYRGIDPLFRLNPNLVIATADKNPIADQLMHSANWVSRKSRYRIYNDRLLRGAFRYKVIAVGDSWFQYPFRIHDIVDHLIDREEYAVLSFGEAGDRLRDVVAKTDFLTALHQQKPDFFLLSAGANDLFGGEGIRRFLKEPKLSFEPEQLIDDVALANFRVRIEGDLSQLIRIVQRTVPGIRILYHGYSYPVPNAGPWIGEPMNTLGIRDLALQRELVRIIIDQFNDAAKNTAASFGKGVAWVDIRDVVPAAGWFDECHPTSPYFGDLAQVFVTEMTRLIGHEH